MKNSVAIARAIKSKLITEGMTQGELAVRVGVAASTVGKWINGETKTISNKLWVKLHPELRPFLPVAFGKELPRGYSAHEDPYGEPAPVVTMSQACRYEPALEALEGFMDQTAKGERLAMPCARDGDVCVRVDRDGCSICPRGSLLCCRPTRRARNGELVLARLSTGEGVIRLFRRDANRLNLDTHPGCDGISFEVDLDEHPGFLTWAWPVVGIYIGRDGQGGEA